MGNRKIDFSSETDKQSSSGPKFVQMKCCAPGCGFTETVNASDPRPFTCKYHQQADRRFWPNITKNIREFIPFYQMGLEFTINRKFDRFVDTEPELLTQWANKNGVPQLAPRKVRTKRGVEYERCYDFGARVLKFFDNHVVSDFMIEDKKLSMQEAEEKRKKEKVDKTFGFIKAFDLSRQIEKRVQQPTQELWPF